MLHSQTPQLQQQHLPNPSVTEFNRWQAASSAIEQTVHPSPSIHNTQINIIKKKYTSTENTKATS